MWIIPTKNFTRTDISAQKHAQEDLLIRANLTQELANRTQEAAHHAEKFQLMAELAPCGTCGLPNAFYATNVMIRDVYIRSRGNYHLGKFSM